ncbi:MAG: carbohydrate porin [Verrucomicrobiota bacterium]|nr:carbohydrate porin [Verrucomicrobiota bacterium]
MAAIHRRYLACLFLPLWQFCFLDRGAAQDSASREIRLARSPGELLPLEVPRGKGVTFPVDLTTEIFGNLAGGRTRAVIWESLFIAGMEVDFEQAAGVPGLNLRVSGLYAAGPSLTNKAVHDFNGLSNTDAYDSVRLYELWLEEVFWDGKISIRAGQMLADAEFFVSDYGALFINSAFGAIPLVSQNLASPVFPVAAPGLRLLVSPNDSFYAEAAAFSGDVGDPGTNNKHGTLFSFREDDGALVIFELGYRVNPPGEEAATPTAPAPLAGTYKLGGFYDSGRFQDESGRFSKSGTAGFYVVAEQELWHSSGKAGQALAVFGRVGMAPEDRNLVPFYFDTGFNFRGIFSSRVADTLGIGFSYTQLSDGPAAGGGNEKVVELTYRLALGDHVSVQPDLQVIIHPGAREDAATAVVAGLRLNLSY